MLPSRLDAEMILSTLFFDDANTHPGIIPCTCRAMLVAQCHAWTVCVAISTRGLGVCLQPLTNLLETAAGLLSDGTSLPVLSSTPALTGQLHQRVC